MPGGQYPAPELVLSAKLDAYRELREQRLANESAAVQRRAKLVLITLQQRLLSSIEAFARTIGVHRQAMIRAAEQQTGRVQHVPKDLRQMLLPVIADDERAEADAEQVVEQFDSALAVATQASLGQTDVQRVQVRGSPCRCFCFDAFDFPSISRSIAKSP